MDKKRLLTENGFEGKAENDSAKDTKLWSKGPEIIFGLGFFGIIGWSVSIPTTIGVALGVFLDKKFAQDFSWTLTLLFVGIILGSFNAWHWIKEKTGNE